MITAYLVSGILLIFTFLFSFLPTVTTIPFVDSYMLTAVGGMRALADTFWFVSDLWYPFLWLIGVESALILVRFFKPHIPKVVGNSHVN